jgi:ferritin-like metal-binding protein YciE
MDDLFVRSLQEIYFAGQELLKALPKMAGRQTLS